MSDAELLAWVRSLGAHPGTQARQLRELLAHAREDQMSAEDRTVVVKALRIVTGAQPVPTRVPTESALTRP